MTFEYEYIIRLCVAGIIGALIGLEREKRFKEAGLRTHFLVAIGSAVFMLVSKYAYFDVLADDVILDPSRVAAAIPSGIGFLGAGMILVQRTSIQGLTTAAGVWATAGIGLAIGGGMYEIGIISGLLVIIGLEFLKRIFGPVIPKTITLTIEMKNGRSVHEIIEKLTTLEITIKEYTMQDKEDTNYKVRMKLQSKNRWKENTITNKLQKIDGVTLIKMDN